VRPTNAHPCRGMSVSLLLRGILPRLLFAVFVPLGAFLQLLILNEVDCLNKGVHNIVQCPARRQGATVEYIGIGSVSSCGAMHVNSKPFTSLTWKARLLRAESGVGEEAGAALRSCVWVAVSEACFAATGVGDRGEADASMGAKATETASTESVASFFIITFHIS